MIFIIDGSADGLFTALFNSYLLKQFPTAVSCGDVQLSIDDECVDVLTNKDKADRVFKKLQKILPNSEIERIFIALKHGDPAKFTIVFEYLKLIVDENKNLSQKYSDKRVLRFDNLVHQVLIEAHRFKGFIRFSKAPNGIYYAKYEPDNDITSLILPHFKERYKNMPFILHDIKHDVLAGHASGKTKIVCKKIKALEIEDEFSSLFKAYYNASFIKERKNEKLMRGFMPKRYHKNLPEKDELI
ncbi:MAG: TIGR03915 family putative DNA repair protein [Clostridia bacterium]|nr:TIGR03915 family putative DNA repair protein [Clostridia bacterium]